MTGIAFVDLARQYARLKPRIDARIQAVMEHGNYILGPEVAEFEARLAELAGARHAVTVSSGTDALIVALRAEEIGSGDAVFVPSFTFAATAGAVIAVGARTVFCDVDADTFTLDPSDLAARIEELPSNLRPRAIIPVDLFGLPADYAAINAIAARHGLFVLADAAQSLGGKQAEKPVGSLAHATATSFFPTKPLGGAGDGGAFFTDDDRRAALARSLRTHGRNADGQFERAGLTARLDTLQAAVLLAKLDVFQSDLERRQAIARAYDAALGDHVGLQREPPGNSSARAVYAVIHERRDALRAALVAEGIPNRVYYERPLHLEPAMAGYGKGTGSLPVCEELSRCILSLPIHPDLDDDMVERICGAVRRAVRTLESSNGKP